MSVLKPSICEDNLEELGRKPLNVHSNLDDIRRIAAAKCHFQRKLMKHAQPRQSLNFKNYEKDQPASKLGDTPYTPSTGSNLLKRQGVESHLHTKIP